MNFDGQRGFVNQNAFEKSLVAFPRLQNQRLKRRCCKRTTWNQPRTQLLYCSFARVYGAQSLS